MNLRNLFNKNTINKTVKVVAATCKKHAPTALAIAACAGVAATAYLASEARPEADEALDILKVDKAAKNEEVTKIDIVKAVAPAYAKTALCGVATVTCIISSNRLQAKKLESLAAAYNLSQTLYSEYQKKVEEVGGSELADKVSNEVSKEIEKHYPSDSSKAKQTGHGDILFKEMFTGQMFYSSIEHIKSVVVDYNYRLYQDDIVQIDDVLYTLGLESSEAAQEFGWDITSGQKIEVRFGDGAATSDHVPYIQVYFNPSYLPGVRY